MSNDRLGLFFDDFINISVFSTCDAVKIRLYENDEDIFGVEFDMEKSGDYFNIKLDHSYELWQYVFLIDGSEVTDPRSVAVTLNSKRSVIVDMKKTNPEGFEEHKAPDTNGVNVIYELHVKDYTYFTDATHNGKFLGLCEPGLTVDGESVGIDNLVELGVTHVHLMPVYDYLTVREEPEYFNVDKNYNWGYDPEHYNVPEGSYASNPRDCVSRIRDLKAMIMEFHRRGLKVVVDVVYNHTFRGLESNFHVLSPFYFHRSYDGKLTNGSGCGNEINTQKAEVRRFLIESLMYWTREYRVDGFRFDLWGLMDVDTAYMVEHKLHEYNPDLLLYGEPWTGGASNLPYEVRVRKGVQRGRGFALFNDDYRNAVKGDNNGDGNGYVQGDYARKIAIETGFLGSIEFDEYHVGFTKHANESINYTNSHDDLCLRDKLHNGNKGMSEEEVIRRYKLALALNILALGNAFITEGNEFYRTKRMIENTYNAPISINGVDWSYKHKYRNIFDFTAKLIELKKNLNIFAYTRSDDIRANVSIIGELPESQLGFYMKDDSGKYEVYFNAGEDELPASHGYTLFCDEVVRIERVGL